MQFDQLKRRDFITLLGGAAAAWPLAARTQQGEPVRRVGAGFVESLARPGGNFTGFTLFEFSIGTKWLELLKEIAPRVKRAAVIRESGTANGTGFFAAIQAVAPALGVELTPVGVRDAGEIERGIAAFARSPDGGLIVTGSAQTAVHRDLIVTLAGRHKLPPVYFGRFMAAAARPISLRPP